MKIIGDGFNTQQGIVLAKQNLVALNPLLNFTQDTIKLCQNSLEGVSFADQNTDSGKQQVISCVVLARLLETAEAIICLSRGGFGNEVNPLFRVFIEAYFIFGNVCRSAEFLPEYFDTDLANRQKMINAAVNRSSPIFHSLKEYATADIRNSLKQEVEEAKASAVDAFKYANAIECGDIYDSIYRLTSAEVHSTPRALAVYTKEAQDHTIIEIYRQPSMGHIPNRLHDLSHFLLTVYSGFNELFGINVQTIVEARRKVLGKLVVIE